MVQPVMLFALAAYGCEWSDRNRIVGSGVAETEQRQIGVFDEFVLSGAGRVEIAIGELQPLEITADDNILPLLRTELTERRVVVRPDVPIRPKTPIVLRVTIPGLTSISVDGAAKITLNGVQNDSLRVDLKGAARVTAQGETENLTASVVGAGHILADDVKARHSEVTLTGTGSVSIHAIETLKVTIAGAGAVTYSGDPKVKKQILGLGTLKRKR